MFDSHIHMYYGKSDTPQEFLEKASSAGITGGNIISLFPAKHSLVESADQRWEYRLEKVLEFTSQAPGFHPLFWIDPTADDFEKQIQIYTISNYLLVYLRIFIKCSYKKLI